MVVSTVWACSKPSEPPPPSTPAQAAPPASTAAPAPQPSPASTATTAQSSAATTASSTPKPQTNPKPATQNPQEYLAKNADVVRTLDSVAPVSLAVGQTLGVMNPDVQVSWQVDVPGEALKLLTPADKVSKPGEAGWVWRAMSPGSIELAFTARTPCPNPPC